jgi:starch phosphorylase
VRASDSDLYMALARTVRQALISRWIKTLETQIGRGSKAVVYLSAEYLLGPSAGQRTAGHESAGDRPARTGDPRPRPRRVAGVRGGARPRQRRPRPPRGLLPRLAGHHVDPGGGLRHPLRVRHLPTDLQRGGPAGRDARHLAAPRQPLGVPAPGDVGRGGLRRHRDPGEERLGPCEWIPSWTTCSRSRTTTWSPATVRTPSTRCGCGAPRRRRTSTSHIFNSGDFPRPVRAQTFAENISKVLYPEDSTPAGQASCACSSSTSSSPLDPRLHPQRCPATSTCADCPSGSSSSSTTPTRSSPSPS